MAQNYQDCWTYPKQAIDKMFEELAVAAEIPAYTASDKGKVLKVNAAGTALEWGTDAT